MKIKKILAIGFALSNVVFSGNDLSVTCDERDRNTKNFISHPCLVAEVLSPSTEAYDRGGKFRTGQCEVLS